MPAEVSITAMQVLIMLLLLVVGAVCYRVKLIGDDGVKSLTNIALYISTSAVIIHSYQIDFDIELAKNILIVGGLALIAHFIGIIIATLIFGKKNAAYQVMRFASVFGNCGFMGIPLIQALMPENGALFATVYMTVFNIFTWTYGVILFSGKTEKGFIKNILLSPVLISVVIGVILFVFSIKLPAPIAKSVEYLSDLNTPLAMLVTGAMIAKSSFFKALRRLGTYKVLFVKLLLTAFIMNFVMLLIPGIPSEVKLAVIVLASTPVASNTAMFAGKYESNPQYAGELVVVSTVLSVVTIPVSVLLHSVI